MKVQPSILVVDDDPKTLASMRLILAGMGEPLEAASGEAALEIVSRKKIELLFLDVNMPAGMSGLETLKRLREAGDTATVVMLSAVDTAKAAVEAMRLGAFDYVVKPSSPEEILVVAEKALKHRELAREVVYFRSERKPTLFENIVGRSPALQEAFRTVSKAAEKDVTILIEGESGTGKELFARAIHFNSPRRQKPFVAVNCAGIPENLLETELFGFEKGAFTGADRQKPGKLELAHEGTLFLDEVSSLRLDMQGKILRALQQREIERVGGTRTIPIDVRILSATNVDLAKAAQEGRFREDLYWRLKVVPVRLPPLRDRREDIPLLLRHFIELYNKKFNKSVKGIREAALGHLVDYGWPGNVRELENLVERLVVLAERDVIDVDDLPFDVFIKSKYGMETLIRQSLILKDARERFEREFITAALEKSGWNQTAAAKRLGIHRNTLILKTEQLGIEKKD